MIMYNTAYKPTELRIVCTSTESDQSLHGILWVAKDPKCLQEDSEDSLHRCVGKSQSSMGAHVIL